SLVALGLFILPGTGLAVFHTRRPGAHVMRGVSQATSQTLLVIAFSLMPLASATAINFSAPLFATLAPILFLRERVGAARRRSLHLAPTAAVAPFQYLSLVWALIIGIAVWGDVPTASLLIGSAIVVGSGIFLFWRESRRAAVATESVEGGL